MFHRASFVLILIPWLASVAVAGGATFRGLSAPQWGERLAGRATRWAAIDTLAQGGAEVVPVLDELLKTRTELGSVRWILGGLGESARPLVPTLVTLLNDEDPDVRRDATRLFRIGVTGTDAIPELVRALSDPVEEVADGAARALGRMGAAAVPGLVDALKPGDARVRARAAAALGAVGEAARPATEGLLRLLRDHEASWKARGNAAAGLGLIGAGSDDVISGLAKGLTDDAGWVRRECAEALGRLGSLALDAVPALIARVDDEYGPARDQAVRALWRLGTPAAAALVSEFRKAQDRGPLARALAAGGREALPWLLPLLENPKAPYTRDVEKALAQVGWEALEVLRVGRASTQRITASVLSDGVRGYCTPFEGFRVELVPGPAAEPSDVEVLWETGSAHGLWLKLHRSRWTENGLRVREVAYRRQRRRWAGEAPVESIGVRATTIPRRRAEAMLRMTLAATGLRVEEEPLADEDEYGQRSGAIWLYSNEFHTAVLMRARGRVLFDEVFTGSSGSLAKVRYARVKACARILGEGLETCAWIDTEPNQEDRSVLAARLNRAGEDRSWVREWLLLMVRSLGDERCLGALEKVIRTPPRSVVRTHRYAISAYARISGVDLRPRPFTDDDVAAVRGRYLAYFDERRKGRDR